jgi:hypothetical protein
VVLDGRFVPESPQVLAAPGPLVAIAARIGIHDTGDGEIASAVDVDDGTVPGEGGGDDELRLEAAVVAFHPGLDIAAPDEGEGS